MLWLRGRASLLFWLSVVLLGVWSVLIEPRWVAHRQIRVEVAN